MVIDKSYLEKKSIILILSLLLNQHASELHIQYLIFDLILIIASKKACKDRLLMTEYLLNYDFYYPRFIIQNL